MAATEIFEREQVERARRYHRGLYLQTEYGKRGAPFSAADTTEGPSADEVKRATETFNALKVEWLKERALDRQAEQLLKRWPDGFPSRPADDATLCPASVRSAIGSALDSDPPTAGRRRSCAKATLTHITESGAVLQLAGQKRDFGGVQLYQTLLWSAIQELYTFRILCPVHSRQRPQGCAHPGPRPVARST